MTEKRPTDVELMLAYQRGDIEAFEELFSRYQGRLFSYLYRSLGDRAEAEDLFQTLFLRLHRARKTYRPEAAFSTWVYTIARNLVRDALEKKAVGEKAFGPEAEGETQNTPEVALGQKELALRLQKAFLSLTPQQREILWLSKYEGFSFPQIAEILGCSVSAAKVRAFRALKALKEALGEVRC